MKTISIFAGFISLQRCVSSVVHGYINISVLSLLLWWRLESIQLKISKKFLISSQLISHLSSDNSFWISSPRSLPPHYYTYHHQHQILRLHLSLWLFQTSGCSALPKQLQLPLPCSYVWMNATKLWFWRFGATQPVQNAKEITNQQLHANTKAAENPNT